MMSDVFSRNMRYSCLERMSCLMLWVAKLLKCNTTAEEGTQYLDCSIACRNGLFRKDDWPSNQLESQRSAAAAWDGTIEWV